MAPVRKLSHDTEVDAARKAGKRSAELAAQVLDFIRRSGNSGMTHDELIAKLGGWSPSGVRGRCSELVDAGYVEKRRRAQTGNITRLNPAGNKSIVWFATDKRGDGADAPMISRALHHRKSPQSCEAIPA